MQTETRPAVKLTGLDSNAFAIISVCQRAARKAGWTADQIGAFTTEATSGNYDHLLQTCMKHFDVR